MCNGIPRIVLSVVVGLLFSSVLRVSAATGDPTSAADTQRTPRLPGQTSTLLPTGQRLLVGGLQQGTPTRTAALIDSTGVPQPLTAHLTIARSAHATTVLPDGRVLVFGGIDKTGAVVMQAEVYDINRQRFDILTNGPTPRRGHTAVMLLDGTLLIVGGRTQQGTSGAPPAYDLATTAELWNPKTGATTVLTSSASSSATGTVSATVSLARDGATPHLLGDGRVLYTGGRDAAGIALTDAIAYAPDRQGFSAIAAAEAQQLIETAKAVTTPQLMASMPEPEVSDFSSDALIAVRFSTPMDVTTVTPLSVVLFGPTGEVDVNVVPAEAGQLIFVTPRLALLPGARYTLFLYAVRAAHGQALPFQALSFNTASLKAADTGQGRATPAPSASTPAAAPKPGSPNTSAAKVLDHDLRLRDRLRPLRARVGAAPRAQAPAPKLADTTGIGNKVSDVDDDDVFVPNASHQGGHWRTGKTTPEFVHALLDHDPRLRDRLTKLRARKGAAPRAQTRGQGTVAAQAIPTPNTPGLGGTVLRLNDQPLANVTISLGTYSTLTDAQGRFHITGVPPGHYELNVDGASASNNGRDYAQFVFGVDIQADRYTELTHALYLPRVRAKDWTNINAPTTTDTVVTHPDIPDLEIRIPQGTVIRDRQGKALTRIAIVPVPLDRAPFPTPANFPVYFMIHPGGAVIQGPAPRGSVNTPGVRIIYPNYTHDAPGTAHNFWMYDARERGWFVYGQAHVSDNGKQIIPDPGVALNEHMAGGHSLGTGPAGPNPAPPPGDGGQGPNDPPQEGDPVDVATGLFVRDLTDIRLSDALPLVLTRTYRPGDTIVRPFGIGTTHNYAMYLRGDFTTPILILPNGAQIVFTLVSSQGHTGNIWQHTASPGKFYGARLEDFSDGTAYGFPGFGFKLTRNDGTAYFFYNYGDNALIGVVDRNGNRLNFQRNGGLIQRITTTTGRYLDFTYDTSNRISKITDIAGRAWNYTYTTAGYLLRATYPNLSFEEYTYDTAGRMLTIKGKRGNIVVTNVYDANGRVSQQTAADGGIYRFAYTTDTTGKVTQTDITDPRNVVRRYSFHATGYPASMIEALGAPSARTTTYVRSATSGHATATIDPLGRRTDYVYDAKGNVTRTTRLAGTPQAVTQNYTYEPAYNQIATYTDPLNKTFRFAYDPKGNLIQITDPLLNKTIITYNGAGLPVTIKDPLGNTTILTYDLSDLVQIRDPLGRVTKSYIDLLGRLGASTDPLGRRTSYEYDLIDRRTRMTDALGQLTQYTYDANSNLLSVTDPRTGKTQYTYDARNRLSLRIDPLLKNESFLYDGNDNVTRYTDRKAQVTNYIYDPFNRRTKATYADATSTTHIFDAGDRLTQVIDTASGTITRTHDGLDRLTTETTPQGSVTYAYDVNSRRTRLTVAGQPAITYLYDNADRLTRITQGTANVSLAYDTASRRTSVTLPNGIIASYGYDSASQLTALTYRLGATAVGNLAYAYDALGQRINITGSLARTSLPSTVTTATNDLANRVTNWNGTTITYDLNGNILNDGLRTYTWDARNRLTQITGPVNASFQYDPFGRRTRKTIGTTTSYLYDGQNPVQELTGTTPTANLLTGLNIDEYFRRTDSLGPRDFITDALGSTLALADSAGVIQTSYTYAPYGNTTLTGQANSNPFQYTGRENDGTGLYYYRARYYDPVRQRFVSSDPIGLAGGLNTYAYVYGNPLRWVDPLGLDPSWLNQHGSVDFTVNVGNGILGASGQISLTGSGITYYLGGGWGVGFGASLTGGVNFGNSSGWGFTGSIAGGGGVGGTASGTISDGGRGSVNTGVNAGVGWGVGSGASVTFGHGGTLISW